VELDTEGGGADVDAPESVPTDAPHFAQNFPSTEVPQFGQKAIFAPR